MSYYKELGKKLREHHLAIDSKVEKIEKYRKYVNTELEYCHGNAYYTEELTYTKDDMPIRIQYPNVYSNEMKHNDEDDSFLLKAGKVYRINANMRIATTDAVDGAKVEYKILNLNTGEYLNAFGVSNTANYASPWGEKDLLITFEPLEDTSIALEIIDLSDGTLTSIQSEISIVEIGRQITIDPLEYVNASQGLEDIPVGHIISNMGNIIPKHYLPCDGKQYNISDYPYLAQSIEDNYGTINHFGGDGVNTFAVPKLQTEEKIIIPVDNGNIIQSSEYSSSFTGANVFDGKASTCWASADSSTNEKYIGWKFDKKTLVNAYSITNRSINADDIKVSPTAFRLQGSNDNETWVDLDIQTNITWAKSNETKSFNFKNNQLYYYYRLFIDEVPYIVSCSISELTFYKNISNKYIKYEPTYFMVNTNYIQPSKYSEEEKVIGCWINGKPLYQKTIKTIVPNGNIDTRLALINVSELNIDYCCNIKGFITHSTGGWVVNMNNSHTQTWYRPKEKQVVLSTSNSTYLGQDCVITIQYTKSTDAENSFDESMLEYVNGNAVYEEYANEDVTNAVNAIWS